MSSGSLLKETISNWSNHKCSTFGAAIAYYSIFSIGPLMLIATVIAGMAFGADAARGEVSDQARGLLGTSGAQALQVLLEGTNHPRQGLLASIFGVATLVFAAVSAVVQLKTALNAVWEIQPMGNNGGWFGLARTYLVSFAGAVALGFLLLVSLLFTTALSAADKVAVGHFPLPTLLAGSILSFTLVTALFAMMFKWLPDADVNWRDIWPGAVLTAALFEIGKFLIGYYVGKLGLESTYGAAASVVMLLIWVYYSSQIVLFGAEFTHVYAQRRSALYRSRAGPSRLNL
jgi:membrane protein